VTEEHTPAERDVIAADAAQSEAFAMVRRLMHSGAPEIDGADLEQWTMRFTVAAHATGWALDQVKGTRSSCEG
jgi:hypothetical protein